MLRNAYAVGDAAGDHDEKNAYLLARGCDSRRRLGHGCDGCVSAETFFGLEAILGSCLCGWGKSRFPETEAVVAVHSRFILAEAQQ
jgi:hypothetical protein